MGDELRVIIERLERLEQLIVSQRSIKDWYSTTEIGEILGRSPYTVREWCRHGEVSAVKRRRGRGAAKEWMISHAELERIRNEGLLPLPQKLLNGGA
jgi:hypothetical protein